MKNDHAGGVRCFTCGKPVHPFRNDTAGNGLIDQCSRCANINELIEELIRKQLRDARPARFAAAF